MNQTTNESDLVSLDTHDTEQIAHFLSGYRRPDLRADEVAPVVLVDEIAEEEAVKRRIGCQVDWQNDREGFAAARRACSAIMLDREVDVWAELGDASTWDPERVLEAPEPWASITHLIDDIMCGIELAGAAVGSAWVNAEVGEASLRRKQIPTRELTDIALPAPLPRIKIVGTRTVGEGDHLVPVLGPVAVLAAEELPDGGGGGEIVLTAHTVRERGPLGVGFTVQEYEVEGEDPEERSLLVVSTIEALRRHQPQRGCIITGVGR